jgi:hemin uptake protein HemP
MADPLYENKSQSRKPHSAVHEPRRGGLPGGAIRRVTSEELLGGASQIVIEHAGQEYRLCKTRNGKLILVK